MRSNLLRLKILVFTVGISAVFSVTAFSFNAASAQTSAQTPEQSPAQAALPSAQAAEPSDAPKFKKLVSKVDIGLLEKKISEKLGGPQISVTGLRWSFNPSTYSIWIASTIAPVSPAFYVLKFEINGKHEVKCNFILIENKEVAYLDDCESSTATIEIPGVLSYTDIGIPTKIPTPNQF